MSTFFSGVCSAHLEANFQPAQRHHGRYRNTVPRVPLGFLKTAAISWDFVTGKSDTTVPRLPIPVQPLTAADILKAPDLSLYRLEHSTVLLKLDGEFWLIDPVFSERTSPVQWAGPKRFHQPPIAIEDLPPIKGVILSHDHFDHLDRAAIVRLAPKVGVFIAPLGVGNCLVAWGVEPARVRQFDWWDEESVGNVRLVAVPAQHFSGRSLFDEPDALGVMGDSGGWSANLFQR